MNCCDDADGIADATGLRAAVAEEHRHRLRGMARHDQHRHRTVWPRYLSSMSRRRAGRARPRASGDPRGRVPGHLRNGFGSSCSQPLFAKRPSQIVGIGPEDDLEPARAGGAGAAPVQDEGCARRGRRRRSPAGGGRRPSPPAAAAAAAAAAAGAAGAGAGVASCRPAFSHAVPAMNPSCSAARQNASALGNDLAARILERPPPGPAAVGWSRNP